MKRNVIKYMRFYKGFRYDWNTNCGAWKIVIKEDKRWYFLSLDFKSIKEIKQFINTKIQQEDTCLCNQ